MNSATPKVLQPLAGAPMLEFVLQSLAELSQPPAVNALVVGYGADKVLASLDKLAAPIRERLSLTPLRQEPQLGTGHAVQMAAHAFDSVAQQDGDVLIVLGDVPLIRAATLERLLAHHREQAAAATMLTMQVADPSGYGRVVRDELGMLAEVVEHKDASGSVARINEVNTGIFAFRAQALLEALPELSNDNAAGEYYLPDVLPWLLQRGQRCSALLAQDSLEVQGVNTRKQQAAADAALRERILDELMEAGVHIVDPANTYIEAGVEIGTDTTVHPFTVIRRGVRIGAGCDVGPFAHVRAGTVLEDTAELGNFCEAKKATLGPHSKAKHLAYLGDVTVGEGSNIGAGTVICNYDGEHKHHTEIGDGVFIGSGSMIVAPRKIADGGRTGAGAVVTKDVEPGVTVAGVPAKPLKRKE